MNLVTGATGHIGNVLVRKLLAAGQSVRVLIFPGEDTLPLQDMLLEMVTGDVLDPLSLRKAMQGVKRVFHLAGLISILPGRSRIVHRVNVEGTKNIIAEARQAGVERLIYTSSIHAIHRAPQGIQIDEQLPFDPENTTGEYDRSKAEASLAVLEAVREGLDSVILCPTGVIGPNDYRRSELGQLILDCVDLKTQFYVDGAYDFVDVRDVAEGIMKAAEKGRSGETYILSGERLTVRRIIDILWDLTGRRFARIYIPFSLARFAARFTPLLYLHRKVKPRFTSYSLETLRSNADISHAKATAELGYHPRRLLETITDTVEWFRKNRRLLPSSKSA
ncbi:MAG: SDR family oxidoreductase [Anaerolineales bacterium]|nr:SDR family oxidoreductase [Anaerolineales bacterium]